MIQFPPKSILVPFDFSSLSVGAWRYAAKLGRRFGAAVELVYVEPWLTGFELGSPAALPTPSSFRPVRDRIREAVGAGPKITIAFGDPAERILHLAETRRPDLIVMGTHGRKGLGRVLLGSVAESVIRQSPVPVLALRGRAREVRSVLAPVNFTDYSAYGLAYAAGVAAALGAKLTVLHAYDEPLTCPDPGRRLAEMLARLPAPLRGASRLRSRVVGGKAPYAVLKAARGHELVVLVARKSSPLGDALLGTTAERVLRRSSAPVLCVPAPRHPFTFAGVGGKSGKEIHMLVLR